ncbi:O-antigen ligase family protein [Enterococcus hailinensis]|uniref:O-antigen ligase family protein n=1 Tax=Enterococcus hailinensis TaxID=3238988 RepID=UPI0038B30670
MKYVSKKINYWREYYLYLFFLGMIIRAVNIYSLLPQTFDSIFFKILGVLGITLLFFDFIINVKKGLFPYSLLLSLYMFFLLVSTIINYRYGVGENAKIIMWSLIQYFVIYQFAYDNPNFEKFFDGISLGFIYSWFVLSLGSIILFFCKFGYEKYYDARHRIRIGFLESRLFGLFSDVNNGAIAALAVIILALLFLYQKRVKGFSKAILVCSIPLQLVFIVLSGSRSTYLITILIIFIGVFTIVVKESKIEKFFYKFLLAILFSGISAILFILFYNFVKWGFQEILPYLKEIRFGNKKDKFLEKHVSTANPTTADGNTLVRKDVADNTDVSNARLSIWKSAFDLFKTSMIIGISPKNIVPYAQNVIPNGYIAKIQIAIHNAYLNVLTSTGILGFIPFSLFLLKSVFFSIKYIITKPLKLFNYRFFYCLILLSYVLYACLNNELVYENTIGTFIFWLFLGRVNNTRGTEKFILFK